MNNLCEWQRAKGLKPGRHLSYGEYEELVAYCGKLAWTYVRRRDDIEELLDRLGREVGL